MVSLQVGKVKAVGEGVKGGLHRGVLRTNSDKVWLASKEGGRAWFVCSRSLWQRIYV